MKEYNKLTCIKTFEPNANSASENDIDIFKNLIWELFNCVIVFMRHIKDYTAINSIDELKAVVKKCIYDDKMKYSGAWNAAPAILSCIKIEDIGTLS